jgi:LPS sulfotransferase NodH
MNLLFPQAHFVHLTRDDLIGQSVSLYKAFGTGQWSSYFEKRREPPTYDFASLLTHYRSLVWENASWEAYFQLTGTEPLRLTYSQVVSEPEGTVSAVATHIGIDTPLPPLSEPTLDRQRDAWNSETRERFESDLIAHGAEPADPNTVMALRPQSGEV